MSSKEDYHLIRTGTFGMSGLLIGLVGIEFMSIGLLAVAGILSTCAVYYMLRDIDEARGPY